MNKTTEDIEAALDWLDGHKDEVAPEKWPIIVDKHTAKQVLRWVLNERWTTGPRDMPQC